MKALGLWGLVYLVNGVMWLFVSEAIRRPHVVTVSIPLRRVTILGLLVSLPMLLLHDQIQHVREELNKVFAIPSWTWIGIATFMIFLITRLHEWLVHHADRLFHRSVAAAGQRLGNAILSAENSAEIETNLVQGVQTRVPSISPPPVCSATRVASFGALPQTTAGITSRREYSNRATRC